MALPLECYLLAHQASTGFEHVTAIQRTKTIRLALGGDAWDFWLHVFVGYYDSRIDQVSNLIPHVRAYFKSTKQGAIIDYSTYIEIWSISTRYIFKTVHW